MVQKKLVAKHVETLHKAQQASLYTEPERAKRYTSLIQRLSRKLRFKLPRPVKHSYCKHCYVPFAPGKNCRVRTRNKMVVYYCLDCKKYTKTVISKK